MQRIGRLALSASLLRLFAPRTPWWAYLVAMVPAAALFVLVCAQPWVPVSNLIRDPVSVLKGRFYDGLVSNLGVLLWCTTAAVCLFRGAELWQRVPSRRGALFLLSAGLFTVLLLFDDLFLAHEQILPELTGLPEGALLGVYPLLLCAYLGFNRRQIMAADTPILLLALGLFALSNLLDVLIPYHFHHTPIGEEVNRGTILEEALKFAGISAWTVFHLRAAWLAGNALHDRPIARMIEYPGSSRLTARAAAGREAWRS